MIRLRLEQIGILCCGFLGGVPFVHDALHLLVATHVDRFIRSLVRLEPFRVVLGRADDRALRLLLLQLLLVTLEAGRR